MGQFDYLGLEAEPKYPFAALWFLMRPAYGPLFWPIIIANGSGCLFQTY